MNKKVVEFNFTKEDFREGGEQYIKKELLNRLWFEGLGVIFVVIITAVILIANKRLPNSIYLLSIGAWIIFCIICNIKIKKELLFYLDKKIKSFDEQDMFGISSLNIDEEGIVLYLNNKKRKYTWKLIKYNKKLKGNLYILISSIDYIFIPKRAFEKNSIESVVKQLNECKGPIKIREIINV